MNFEEYYNQNPRKAIPDNLMRKFLAFAISRYKEIGDQHGVAEVVVNFCHLHEDDCENEDEFNCWVQDEVQSYLGNSMEALLLFKEFLEANNGNNSV